LILSLFYASNAFAQDINCIKSAKIRHEQLNLPENSSNLSRIQISDFWNQITDSVIIPLKRAGNLILIETVIDGVSGNLIFDSGASSILVLNKTWFRTHKRIGNKSATGITGNLVQTGIVNIDSLCIAQKIFTDIKPGLIIAFEFLILLMLNSG
jgi:hypothetical protein